jgi:serine/threonine-protein kinase
MSCPHCGTPTTADARFCGGCGRALEKGAVTVAEVEEEVTVAAPARPAAPAPRPSSQPASSGWLTSSDSISHGRFAPGAILDGRYRVIGLLGRGGMGEVYRADDLRLGQPVALKFLPDTVATDPVRLAQFHNEVRTARQVSHPNICRVYDIGEIEGHLFLSMEYVDGEDLATSLRRIGRFPEDKATDLARQLCAGLAAAHERGVIHRDLKPANIMLDDAGKVRVMDFGLAAVGTVEEIRVGTPAYMAPEQLLGKEVTARSDIYALGLVLYEIFTGRRAFTASTLNDLVEHHQSGQITPPSAIVSTLDPAIERAILRCLERDPARRPASALAVSAALPGGDPLAAALAAGETPSPEMVAAAGEGAGLSLQVAVAAFVAVVALLGITYAMALRISLLERVHPEFSADVLAQKARDAIRELGYTERPQDEASGFAWDGGLVGHLQRNSNGTPARNIQSGPSPVTFWYRRSQQAMTGLQFHRDLLTPGVVSRDDPAPILSGMIHVRVDSKGLVTEFEAIPPQVVENPEPAGPVDWTPMFKVAGLDPTTLQTVTPQWHWLAASDTRAAWTGTWPGTNDPLRVEAAALSGKPVAFQLIGPWTRPWRTTSADEPGATAIFVIYFVLALCIVIGAAALAARHLREGRGDRKGAQSLAVAVVSALWLVWMCDVHVAPTIGLFAMFLVAIATTVFYGVLFWAIYLALEPFVRRHWPQTLVSWTTLLSGRVRDPIVGLGALVALLIISTISLQGATMSPDVEALTGVRAATGFVLIVLLSAVRFALLIFYLLFLLRVLLRNKWAAALAFALLFAVTDALDSDTPWVEGGLALAYFSMLAAAVLRSGLTALATALFVGQLILSAPATADLSAWYIGPSSLVLAIPLLLAAWAFRTSLRGSGAALAAPRHS